MKQLHNGTNNMQMQLSYYLRVCLQDIKISKEWPIGNGLVQ